MPTRKIAEPPHIWEENNFKMWPPVCQNPEHNPPSMMVYSPGTWEHICPGCGHRVEFTVGTIY